MKDLTQRLWEQQDRHPGDRLRLFADVPGVNEIIARHRPTPSDWRFIGADYTTDLDVADEAAGLLVSLYAGFISEHCTRYLRSGRWLLVNPSHGDVAMASISSEYRLGAVVNARSGRYTVTVRRLEDYLIPKKATTITREMLHERGRGIAYTKSPLAYLFQRSAS